MSNIRVRFAPSPTGPFHIGSARTALFNWLFARHHGGAFVLRIEDTDLERSDPKYEKDIIESLAWLGLNWDKFYRQSERLRLDIYEKYLKQLLTNGDVFWCSCPPTKPTIKWAREVFVCPHRENPDDHPNSKTKIIRFKNPYKISIERGTQDPEKFIQFSDLIRGTIASDKSLLGDFSIAKDLKTPLYNFAVVVDDHEMQISHVIRGEDHIANTPKQMLLQQALGFKTPEYVHLPLILNPDRSKLSKRFAETSLLAYREKGYLPEALLNFLAFLGWHPKEDKDVMTIPDLIKEFELERVQKSGAVFNEEKLEWLNSKHIKNLTNERLAELISPKLQEDGVEADRKMLLKALAVEKDRMKTLNDFVKSATFFFKLPDYDASLLIWKNTDAPTIKANLSLALKLLELCKETEFDKIQLEAKITPLTEKAGRGEVLWPLRAALSGSKASPGPFEIMEVLGKMETLRRINVAISKL